VEFCIYYSTGLGRTAKRPAGQIDPTRPKAHSRGLAAPFLNPQHFPPTHENPSYHPRSPPPPPPPTSWQWTIPQRYQAARPFDATGLAAVQLNSKWGLIDKSGKQILPCAYDEITAYPDEACFALRTGSQWGLADSNGKVILRPEWDAVQPLIRGFIPVQRFGKWGYADASGKLVIPCAWDDAWRFSPAGTAVVTKGTGPQKKRGFIDRTGRIITAPAWDGALNHVAEGLGAVRRGYSWALVDKNGKPLGEPEWGFWWKSLRADLGFLPVWKDNKWGAIGLDGKLLVPTEWETMTPGKNGILFANPGAEAVFIGKNGKTLFTTGPWDEVRGNQYPEGEWNKATTFSEGYLAVRSGDKWGLINEEGDTVLPPAWDRIGEVHEGCVAAKNNDSESGWQMLKPDGSPAFKIPEGKKIGQHYNPNTPPRFRNGLVRGWEPKDEHGWGPDITLNREGKPTRRRENAWLPEGLSIHGLHIDHVSRNGRYGYLRNIADKTGRILITDVAVELDSLDHPFPYPGPSRYGLATPDGKILLEPNWDRVEPHDSGMTLVWKEGRVGVVNKAGRLVLQPEWDSIWITENNLLRAKRDKTKLVFNSQGAPVIPEEMPDSQYVDFYGTGCITKTKRPDKSTLWSLCDPATGAPVHFENAARVYWNRSMAENGVLWIEERDSGQWSLIRRDGTPLGIRQDTKPEMWTLTEGLARHTKEDATVAFTDTNGVELASQPWDDARNFQNGLAAVMTDGKWGFIDKTGKLVIPAIWDDAGDFQNIGTESAPLLRAIVTMDETQGLLDAKGNMIGKLRWDRIDRFQNVGQSRWLAIVHSGANQGFVDGNGTVVVEPEWEKIGEFRDYGSGRWLAEAHRNGKVGFLDATGRMVLEPMGKSVGQSWRYPGLLALKVETKDSDQLQDAVFLPDGTPINPAALRGNIGLGGTQILITSRGKSGLYSPTGTVLIEPRWDHMAWVAPGIVAAWTDSDGALLDTKGRVLFRDNATRRLARFHSPRAVGSPGMHKHGVVLIETPPVWGFATLTPPGR
jgi:hypothetical protein